MPEQVHVNMYCVYFHHDLVQCFSEYDSGKTNIRIISACFECRCLFYAKSFSGLWEWHLNFLWQSRNKTLSLRISVNII